MFESAEAGCNVVAHILFGLLSSLTVLTRRFFVVQRGEWIKLHHFGYVLMLLRLQILWIDGFSIFLGFSEAACMQTPLFAKSQTFCNREWYRLHWFEYHHMCAHTLHCAQTFEGESRVNNSQQFHQLCQGKFLINQHNAPFPTKQLYLRSATVQAFARQNENHIKIAIANCACDRVYLRPLHCTLQCRVFRTPCTIA